MQWVYQPFVECYQFREVLYNLLSRDLKLKYKRTALGYLWSLLNPLIHLGVLSFVFSHFVGRGMRDYTLYLFAGLLPWSFFQQSVHSASIVFLDYEGFLKKVYLPKLLFPLSRLGLRLVDFLLSLTALTLLGLVLKFPLHLTYVLVPIAILNLFVFTLGVSILVAITSVYFRDMSYLVNIALQLLYFVTPIIYPIQMLPSSVTEWLKWNPLYWQIGFFQSLIYEGRIPTPPEAIVVFGTSLISFGVGIWLLNQLENEMVFRL